MYHYRASQAAGEVTGQAQDAKATLQNPCSWETTQQGQGIWERVKGIVGAGTAEASKYAEDTAATAQVIPLSACALLSQANSHLCRPHHIDCPTSKACPEMNPQNRRPFLQVPAATAHSPKSPSQFWWMVPSVAQSCVAGPWEVGKGHEYTICGHNIYS